MIGFMILYLFLGKTNESAELCEIGNNKEEETNKQEYEKNKKKI